MIPLNCPLIFLDTETTGVHPKVDRVVQIGLVKVYPDGRRTEWETYVNPKESIPPEVSAIHGITDELAKEALTFKELSYVLWKGFVGCDYAGFNVTFDLAMLTAEFERVHMKSPFNGRIVDCQNVYRRYHRRTLSDAVKLYLQADHEQAHNALSDARVCVGLLEAQLLAHPELPQSVEGLHSEFQEQPKSGAFADPDGRLSWRHGKVCINFGQKHVNTPLEQVDRRFLQWVLKSDFSDQVKRIVQRVLDGEIPKRYESLTPAGQETLS